MKLFCSSATRLKLLEHPFTWSLIVVLLVCSGKSSHAVDVNTAGFNIASGKLSDSLDKFSAQTGLQILYEEEWVTSKRAGKIIGTLPINKALDRLLRGTGLHWRFVNSVTVAITRTHQEHVSSYLTQEQEPQSASVAKQDVVTFADVDVKGRRWLPSGDSTSSFGFSKPLFETPRSVSFISEETIDVFGLSAVEDLLRVAPGVFTTTRFGIQGSVDIRNVPADTYFRGMKRLTLQGHGRSVLAAMDSIEIVGGPPSPLYGMGKIGGYTNVVPKSGRAKSGQYLTEIQGFAQLIGGQYDRREFSFGMGGPVSVSRDNGKQGGYYIYGLIEDSNSYTRSVPIKQQLLQAAISVDNFIGSFRLETGSNFQISRTSGALTGRLTQDLVDHDRYISGSPLANLDLNNNGSIGYLEMASASAVRGNLTANNQPLSQVWVWPTGANGQPLPLDQFPTISGIPQSMYTYLVAHPEADPGGLLRAQGVGGPIPVSGAVPVGMVLDPRTIAYNSLDLRHSSAFERALRAQFITAYADLINDENPDSTIKNQLFFDSMDQFKSSNQPFSQIQDVYVVEDKLTATRRVALPWGIHINNLVSLNVRNTVSKGRMTLADYSNHRTDAASPAWNEASGGMIANTTFVSANDNSNIANDGFPWTSVYRTEYSEVGAGLLFDADFRSGTNVLLGGRIDGLNVENIDYAGRFNLNTGTATNPGAYLAADDKAKAWDRGTSWSISLSQQLPYEIRPYLTVAKSSITLDGNNNTYLNTVIRTGPLGSSTLQEAGIKANLFDSKLFVTAAAYKQGRVDLSETDDPSLFSAYATATTTWGWQTEIKWMPSKRFLLSLYTLRQTTDYTPNLGGTIQVDARTLGFRDVVDANNNVVYPAEAFLYGGRARILLPNNLEQYKKKQGNPGTQVGISGIYETAKGFGVTFKGNYLSSTCSGRLCLVRLPQSHLYDLGAFWESRIWSLKADVFNLTDEHYYRARTGDTLGDVIAQAMPGRRWQLTAKYSF